MGVWLQYQTAMTLLQRSAFVLGLGGFRGARLCWAGWRRAWAGARRGSGARGDIIKAICAILFFHFLPLFENKCVGTPAAPLCSGQVSVGLAGFSAVVIRNKCLPTFSVHPNQDRTLAYPCN